MILFYNLTSTETPRSVIFHNMGMLFVKHTENVGDSQQKTEEPGASLTLDLPNQFVTRGTNV